MPFDAVLMFFNAVSMSFYDYLGMLFSRVLRLFSLVEANLFN
jgi:hypothetical protein